MERNGSCWTVDAETILDQLLQYAAQLAEFENDPRIDIRALSDECTKRTEALKQVIPAKLDNFAEADSEVLDKMRTLYTRTQDCLSMLHQKSNAVSVKIQRLSKTRQAVKAYGKR
ncbi:MAG: hypothetical protein ACP5IL_07485 [Syntrophobacteraceae bacterium]